MGRPPVGTYVSWDAPRSHTVCVWGGGGGIRVPKFSAGASRYTEAQPEQAEVKRRSR